MRLKLPKSGAPAWLLPTEAVVQQCSVKEMFLEISQNLASDYNFIKKDTLAQVFSYKFCEISKNNFFLTVHLRWLLLYRNYYFKVMRSLPDKLQTSLLKEICVYLMTTNLMFQKNKTMPLLKRHQKTAVQEREKTNLETNNKVTNA